MKEIWKDIPDYEGLYQASSLGRIKSLPRIIERGSDLYIKKGLILKLPIHTSGYIRLNLVKNKKSASYYVHVLILTTFKGDRPKDCDVDHIDKDRKNNKASNLRWLNYKKNRATFGDKNGNSKLNRQLKKQLK